MSHAETPMCTAVSQAGTKVKAYGILSVPVIRTATAEQWFICTQHPDYRGDHTSCDGRGHVLASWPRRRPEEYWTGCGERCDHPHRNVS